MPLVGRTGDYGLLLTRDPRGRIAARADMFGIVKFNHLTVIDIRAEGLLYRVDIGLGEELGSESI